eukprot:m.33180 g.33180  ORF g.33180 m.33180 type:complete len:215 (+) comp10309_c0_seq1:264-908(+)
MSVQPRVALWLVPSAGEVERVANAPDGQGLVLDVAASALGANGCWGGHLHMTLTSFAGPPGTPDDRGLCHGVSLWSLAEHVVQQSGVQEEGVWQGSQEHVGQGGLPWGCVSQPSNDFVMLAPTVPSGRLRALCAAIGSGLHGHAALNPRGPNQLHVTLRSQSGGVALLQLPLDQLAQGLAAMSWDVCVAIDNDPFDPGHHRVDLQHRCRFGQLY